MKTGIIIVLLYLCIQRLPVENTLQSGIIIVRYTISINNCVFCQLVELMENILMVRLFL